MEKDWNRLTDCTLVKAAKVWKEEGKFFLVNANGAIRNGCVKGCGGMPGK